MKNLFTVLAFMIAIATSTQAQEEKPYIEIGDKNSSTDIQTFSDGPFANGVYLGITTHYGNIEKKNSLFAGGKLAYVASRNLEVGVRGNGLFTKQDNIEFMDDNLNFTGGYGGLHVAAVLQPAKRVHLSFPVLIGGGAVGYYEQDLKNPQVGERKVDDWDEIFAGEAGVNAVFNIAKHFQVEAGASYVITSEVELDRVETFDLNGILGGIGLRFGLF